ncbi:hypothetical protein O1L60_39420 [Streptomyces diastatochromogenes]|nr:hypothetical protein [Streptomyces diastatochromogenes]
MRRTGTAAQRYEVGVRGVLVECGRR